MNFELSQLGECPVCHCLMKDTAERFVGFGGVLWQIKLLPGILASHVRVLLATQLPANAFGRQWMLVQA